MVKKSVKKSTKKYVVHKKKVYVVKSPATKKGYYYSNGKKVKYDKTLHKSRRTATNKLDKEKRKITKVKSRKCKYGVKKACLSPCKKRSGKKGSKSRKKPVKKSRKKPVKKSKKPVKKSKKPVEEGIVMGTIVSKPDTEKFLKQVFDNLNDDDEEISGAYDLW
jgi:hypothetical protein